MQEAQDPCEFEESGDGRQARRASQGDFSRSGFFDLCSRVFVGIASSFPRLRLLLFFLVIDN